MKTQNQFQLKCAFLQYSSDDTQEHSAHSKHKHKTHSRDDSNNGGSRSREHGQENHDGGSVNRHKNSSKHSKDEERHHRSRYIYSNSNLFDNVYYNIVFTLIQDILKSRSMIALFIICITSKKRRKYLKIYFVHFLL